MSWSALTDLHSRESDFDVAESMTLASPTKRNFVDDAPLVGELSSYQYYLSLAAASGNSTCYKMPFYAAHVCSILPMTGSSAMIGCWSAATRILMNTKPLAWFAREQPRDWI